MFAILEDHDLVSQKSFRILIYFDIAFFVRIGFAEIINKNDFNPIAKGTVGIYVLSLVLAIDKNEMIF